MFKNSCLVVFLSLLSQVSLADLKPMSLSALDKTYGRIDFVNPETLSEQVQSQLSLGEGELELTQGIELDLDIQVSLDMEWRDGDGYATPSNEGSAGSLIFSGIHLGSSETPLTALDVASERPFLGSEVAIIRDLYIDVDPQQGMFITLNELGDKYGNGLDIIVNDIHLGDANRSAGGFLIEDVSNFIRNEQLVRMNTLFGMDLWTVDDGKGTQGGNWIPFQMLVKTNEGQSADDVDIPDIELPTQDVPLPSIAANSEISASFVLSVDKLAWVDDGNEVGLAGVMVYDGIDTNNDGVDDLVGPARLTDMKIETVDHKTLSGEDVKALHIANLDFKADIAIQSIYVGDPTNGNLGSLLIRGLDTSGTSLWIYNH